MRIDDTWCQEALDIIKDIDANVLITRLGKCYPYEVCSQYDLIATCTTGTEHIHNNAIPLISLKGETEFLQDVHATAEHTWALIMALIRKVPFAHNDVGRGNWNREAWQGTELHGKTLGIVGYGRVGKQVERYARAFGMNVIICDPPTTIVEEAHTIHDCYRRDRTLDGLLREADIVIVHVPLNEETENMFGMKEFEQMKPTAYFINTSRGGVVNHHALEDALTSGEIAGAALDVLEGEPHVDKCVIEYLTLFKNNRLEKHDNLIITPHISGNTLESRHKTQVFIANKIRGYINTKGECI